jgi:hypothetical protein
MMSALLCACTASTTGADGTPNNTSSATVPVPSHAHKRPDCRSSVGGSRYGSHLEAESGNAGDLVRVFGTTFRSEDGRFAPSKRLEVWWNTRFPAERGADAEPVNADSPIILLTTVSDMHRCHFQTTFEVPDVPPGRYLIRTVVFSQEGYGIFGYHHFTVV